MNTQRKTRGRRYTVRFAEDEAAMIEREASHRGINVSTLMREIMVTRMNAGVELNSVRDSGAHYRAKPEGEQRYPSMKPGRGSRAHGPAGVRGETEAKAR